MAELIILRHARAEPFDAHPRDFDRELTGGGRRQSRRAGEALLAAGAVLDRVTSSTAPRAMETARLACAAMNLDPARIVEAPGIYGASTEQLLEILRQQADHAVRLMIVGHNPGITDLATWLTGERQELGKAGWIWLRVDLQRPAPGSAWILDRG